MRIIVKWKLNKGRGKNVYGSTHISVVRSYEHIYQWWDRMNTYISDEIIRTHISVVRSYEHIYRWWDRMNTYISGEIIRTHLSVVRSYEHIYQWWDYMNIYISGEIVWTSRCTFGLSTWRRTLWLDKNPMISQAVCSSSEMGTLQEKVKYDHGQKRKRIRNYFLEFAFH
jgi:hypothetical protein